MTTLGNDPLGNDPLCNDTVGTDPGAQTRRPQPRRLVVFARHPEPGKAKTRLIPALGPEGAARLQHEMTCLTLSRLARLPERGTRVEICYAGAGEATMKSLYGPGWRYSPQSDGDLGVRLRTAAAEAFTDGCAAVALIGTDCPDLSAETVESAFAALATADVVLGPAADGGYYLIALRRSEPELFQDIPWGTAAVLEATHRAAERLRLGVALLPVLRDVDTAEDLDVWRRAQEKEI